MKEMAGFGIEGGSVCVYQDHTVEKFTINAQYLQKMAAATKSSCGRGAYIT